MLVVFQHFGTTPSVSAGGDTGLEMQDVELEKDYKAKLKVEEYITLPCPQTFSHPGNSLNDAFRLSPLRSISVRDVLATTTANALFLYN